MTDFVDQVTPRMLVVVTEQIRSVGLAVRREVAVLAVPVVLLTIVVLIESRDGSALDLHLEDQFVITALAFLLPFVVWKGEDVFGDAHLWTLPVGRRRHALAKVFAGWTWQMAATAAYLLWLLGLAVVTGGAIAADKTWLMVGSSQFDAVLGPWDLSQGALDPRELATVRWSPRPWQWIVPFTGATVAYLIGSSVALGMKHRWRWVAGIVVGVFLLTTSGPAPEVHETILQPVLGGSYGLDYALTAGTETLNTEIPLPNDEVVVVWLGLPTLRQWLIGTVIWTVIGLATLSAAVSRHREPGSKKASSTAGRWSRRGTDEDVLPPAGRT